MPRLFTANPPVAALVGSALVVPLLALNLTVENKVEPFFSAIRSSPLEHVLLAVSLLLLPVGAFVALRPIWRTGRPSTHVANWLVAAVLVGLFGALSVGIGEEVYRCEVLQIPNCD